MSIAGVAKVEGDANKNTFSHKLNMVGHEDFFEGRVKVDKGTLSEGVTKKDTRIGFGIEFVGRMGT